MVHIDMKDWLKKLAHVLLGDYSVYHVYTKLDGIVPAVTTCAAAALRVGVVDRAQIESNADPVIRSQLGYHVAGAHAYACFDGERIVGLCFYWHGERYRERNYWPLAEGEAKLVQVIIHPDLRGRGVARTIIALSYQDMISRGFHRAYARIWHSNTASLRAFERAGWSRISTVAEVNPLRRARPFRITFGAHPRGMERPK